LGGRVGNKLCLKICVIAFCFHATLPINVLVETLNDMDAEISALEEKLVKARMMSELLTGKIRLV